MADANILDATVSAPKGFMTSEALLKVKGLIWTEALDNLVQALTLEEKEWESLQVELLGLYRDKKKCYKRLLELSLDLQNGNLSVKSPLEICKKELDNLNEVIENLEYKRDLFPSRIKVLENTLFQQVIETVYASLSESQLKKLDVIDEIETLRSVIKEKWSQKFDLDAKIISLDGYLHGVLSKDELDVFDSALLKGRDK